MKFKVDENLPLEACELLRDADHDVAHVLDEHLGGCPDFDIAGICNLEERILVSLDTDFANIRAYPPMIKEFHENHKDQILVLNGRANWVGHRNKN